MTEGISADHGLEAQAARLRQFLGWSMAMNLALLAFLAGIYLAFHASVAIVLAGETVLHLALLAWARRQAARGLLGRAILAASTGLWVVGLTLAFAVPPFLAVVAQMVVIPAALALPYLPSGSLRRLMVATTLVALIAVVISLRVDALATTPAVPPWVRAGLLVALVPLTTGLICLLLWHYSSRLNETLAETRAANAALRTSEQLLAAQVIELDRSRGLIAAAEERLRREIAELLHSRVQNKLLLAWYRLEECQDLLARDPEQAGRLLAEVRSQLDQLREQDVRQVSHLLHPSIIRVGLVPAVEQLAEEFEDRVRVSVQLDDRVADLDEPARNRIPERVRLAAYRVVEEALGNVARHARASRVEVSLAAREDRRLEITVRDDGRGFDPERVQAGLGLSSLAARVGRAGGSWQLASALGQGTTLRVTLPLTPGDEDDQLEPPRGAAGADGPRPAAATP